MERIELDNPDSAMAVVVAMYGQCVEKQKKVYACGYHKDRAACSYYELPILNTNEEDNSEEQFSLEITKEIKKMGRLFRDGRPRGGSWALVGSQREWFESQLTVAYARAKGDRVRHLIGGVASYVHFLGTLSIIDRAIRKSGIEMLEITVCDGCIYPIKQIAAFERLIRRRGLSLTLPWQISVPPYRIEIPASMIKRIKALQYLDKISIRYYVDDLINLKPNDTEKFDVISEHFVTSMYNKERYKNLIANIRNSYVKILNPGAWLITADGYKQSDDGHRYRLFVDEHENLGFRFREEHSKCVWDPYGLSPEIIIGWADRPLGSKFPVHKSNALSVFELVS